MRDGIDLPEDAACRYPFTLVCYRTSGATWASAGTASLVGRSTGAIERGATRLTLVVPLDGCFAQVELHTGEARYEADAAPSYPRPVPRDVAVATWNGARDCTGPGVVADLAVIGVPACPQDASLTWLVVNPNGRAVEAALVTEGQGAAWTRAVMAVPGRAPVVVARGPAMPDAVVVTWVDGSGISRSVRSAPALPLGVGTPEHTARCVARPLPP